MQIEKRKFEFELESVEGVAGIGVYYGEPPLDYDSSVKVFSINDLVDKMDASNKVTLTLPDDVPINNGLQAIGVSTYDDNGNESDIEQIEYFFDFTPPMKPKNLRVY